MANIIICREKVAETPFMFLNTKVEVSTYEELCFYIYNNTVLISKSTLSEKLFNWIRDELGMTQLAERLYALSNKVSFAQDMLVEILNAGDYYSPEEIKQYIEALQKYKKMPHIKREKMKADAYLNARRYIRAATIYDNILDYEKEVQDRPFFASVYQCRAIAAANNMDTADAKKYFLKAYELGGDPRSLKGYFFVVSAEEDITTLRSEVHKFGLDDEYFENIMGEIGDSKEDVREMTVFAMLQRAVYNKLNKDMTDYDKRMDIILAEIKDEFRDQAI